MLSQAAFNAFLKTLEEPPQHAIFILATTEKHKVLPTILSRCQTYDFTRITIGDIVEHLQYVASSEGIATEPEALNVIAQKADGGMRDALSIFDQVASYTNGNITYQAVIDNLNVLDFEYYFQLTDAILNKNIRKALLLFNDILNKGFDAQNFITGLASHFRDLMVCKNEETLVLFEVGASIRERYKEMAKICQDAFLYRAIELTNSCDMNYRASRNKRLLVELTLIQLCQLLQPADDAKKKTQLEPLESKTNQPQASSTQPTTQAAKAAGITQTAVPPSPIQKQPHITTPASAPRKTGKAPVGTSLKELVQAKVQQQTAMYGMGNQDGNTLNQPFTEQDLQESWVEYAHSIEKNAYLQNIMLNNLPAKQEEAFFEVKVHNPGMQEELINNTINILSALRNKLKNSHIQMRIKMMESNEKHLAYTASEKFQHMMGINPIIAKLKEEFNLTSA